MHASGHRSTSSVSVSLCVHAVAATPPQLSSQTSCGTSWHPVGSLSSPIFPCWQYFFPDAIALNFKNAFLSGFATGGKSWFSQASMLWTTSIAIGLRANQPTNATKKDTVEAQKARM
ncbi:unnamed protein product [Prorocentrum cordatum]|uniref:Secreted protein n=1 Tax=Prorocentrum cordatum TaxID=2364126 RepID=A0ABN9W9K7_9DINO|nr:unnamed protein product [Polarella glacialis]